MKGIATKIGIERTKKAVAVSVPAHKTKMLTITAVPSIVILGKIPKATKKTDTNCIRKIMLIGFFSVSNKSRLVCLESGVTHFSCTLKSLKIFQCVFAK